MSEMNPYTDLTALLKGLIAQAETGRECLIISFSGTSWEAYFKKHSAWGYDQSLNAALAKLQDSSAAALPIVQTNWDAEALAGLIGPAAEKLSEQGGSFTFICDYRKVKGNVFKAEAYTGGGFAYQSISQPGVSYAKKLGNDAVAAVGEALGKVGLL